MIHSLTGPLPKHRYVWIQPDAIGTHGWLRAVWYGLQSFPSRAWGCHVLLGCGAAYRNIPLHQLAAFENAEAGWTPGDAQVWDCYGTDFTAVEYPFLAEMGVRARLRDGSEQGGSYLFSVAPIGDGWSNEPEQSKEFFFLELDNGRFAALPTNCVLFDDKSFSKPEWPTFLRRQTDVWSAEE